jgi:hypothetical protein
VARSRSQAAGDFVDSLQQIVSGVTNSVLRLSHGGYGPDPGPHKITFPRGPAEIDSSPEMVLKVSHWYYITETAEPAGTWRVHTASYYYGLELVDGPEIIAYHWHPEGQSQVTWPHLHLEAGAQVGFDRLAGIHLPSGRVALEEIIRMAIGLGARPLRNDWEGCSYGPITTSPQFALGS